MITQRFKSKFKAWNSKANGQFMGLTHLLIGCLIIYMNERVN